MRLTHLLLAAAALLCSTPAFPLSTVTGLSLLHDCQSAIKGTDDLAHLTTEQDRASGRCISYVQGLMDANEFWVHRDKVLHGSTKHYCIERDTSLEQVIRILVKYLENTPKDLNENGWICLEAALQQDFPCKG